MTTITAPPPARTARPAGAPVAIAVVPPAPLHRGPVPPLTLEGLLPACLLPSALDVGPELRWAARRPAAAAPKPVTTPLAPFDDVAAEQREARRRLLLLAAAGASGAVLTVLSVLAALG